MLTWSGHFVVVEPNTTSHPKEQQKNQTRQAVFWFGTKTDVSADDRQRPPCRRFWPRRQERRRSRHLRGDFIFT